MCYDYVIRIAWILSIQFAAASTTTTSTSPEALPIVWRTSTIPNTHLPVLPTYLVPPPKPIPHSITLATRNVTQLPKHPNHNYDSIETTPNQLLHDINNLDLTVNNKPSNSIITSHHNQHVTDTSDDQRQRDRARLKALYSESFPVLGQPDNMTLETTFGNAGNDSLGRLRYEGTLMAFVNNPFGNGKIVGKEKAKKCSYNSKKCNSTLATSTPHSTNQLLLDSGDSSDSFSPLDQPAEDDGSNIEPRYKRGVIHLYNMVSCATGCNPLIYKGYGCYCGFLGSGYAVDGIDRCCKFHDWCYDTAKCPMYLEYFIPYYWKCYHRRPICAIEHGEWGGAGSCAQRLCECDRVLSECLSRYPCPSTRAICTSSPWRLLQNAFMIL